MANANRPSKGQGRADDNHVGKGARPDSPGQPRGSRGADTGSDLSDMTGQKNKPGIGQPGRGGDDLSGQGIHRTDTRSASGGGEGATDSGDESDAKTNTGRGQVNTPGRSPGGGSNPSSRQHASQPDTDTGGAAGQMRSGQPLSSGEETLGGNQGAF
jgi:hypothetical protein